MKLKNILFSTKLHVIIIFILIVVLLYFLQIKIIGLENEKIRFQNLSIVSALQYETKQTDSLSLKKIWELKKTLNKDEINTLTQGLKAKGFSILDKIPTDALILKGTQNTVVQVYKTQNTQGVVINNQIVASKPLSLMGDRINLALIGIIALSLILLFIVFNTFKSLKDLVSIGERIANGENYKNTHKNELKGVIDSISTAYAQALTKLKWKELLLRNIGHEIRAPMTKMKLLVALEWDKSTLAKLQIYIKQMQHILENTLEFERLSYKKPYLEKKEFLSETLLFEALNNFIDEEKFIELDVQASYPIKGDLHLLCVALSNLIQNALKYSKTGFIKIELRQTCILIKNEGNPLSKDISYYLEPFYRDKKHQSLEGYGLGLFIVKEILLLHGASLEYSYKDGMHGFRIAFANTEDAS
ncbi:hypothetical protein BKH43_06210 [Helicobacter sp. 13S00401-1]|uniref:sensor histidine kinase n=1 Tax=Helicobacter sp. 13S00401-1 TaxID=1905758 RepID=UPI000BA5FE82|nr:HAMP domain-containing sensor histidine kinase [Helicobacter sp. 13S00401-1]PAF50083.1 hypothetical protein BKH43_06210 [Helicobacter sp. 13S00401-1]